MAKVKTTVTQTAEKKFRYRFICEHCGHETDWFAGKIAANANATYKGSLGTMDTRVQNNSQLNTRALDNLTTAVRDIEDRLRKGKIIGGIFLKYKCPKCRKKQSWSGASSQNWITTSLFVIFIVLGIAWTVANIVRNQGEAGLSAFAPLFGCLIPLIIMAVISSSHANKNRKEIMNKNIGSLEIDWLDGRLPIKY